MKDEVTSREKILTAIRNSIVPKESFPMWKTNKNTQIFRTIDVGMDIHFAQTFTALGGKFVFCQNLEDLGIQLNHILNQEQWSAVFCNTPKVQSLLESFDIGFLSEEDDEHDMVCQVTDCEFLVSRFGSVLMSSALPSGRRGHAWSPVHIVIAYASQLKMELGEALETLAEKYEGKMPSAISLISGPSRTADIEKTLVMGAHGPKALYVFYVDNE